MKGQRPKRCSMLPLRTAIPDKGRHFPQRNLETKESFKSFIWHFQPFFEDFSNSVWVFLLSPVLHTSREELRRIWVTYSRRLIGSSGLGRGRAKAESGNGKRDLHILKQTGMRKVQRLHTVGE